ncbi:hypothetical protein FBEOM_12431 [Fusarium beomiforme]|uniref:Uncharacterized protein n=1 Tax=Fusarium beomiforme TaxID=44412 RepID=A0A9P5A7P0_9HYPO|nr:hypothetical protein FBEOM_12431 [Fusarium beomiforme]
MDPSIASTFGISAVPVIRVVLDTGFWETNKPTFRMLEQAPTKPGHLDIMRNVGDVVFGVEHYDALVFMVPFNSVGVELREMEQSIQDSHPEVEIMAP